VREEVHGDDFKHFHQEFEKIPHKVAAIGGFFEVTIKSWQPE